MTTKLICSKAAADRYFKGRPLYDTLMHRKIFEAGFELCLAESKEYIQNLESQLEDVDKAITSLEAAVARYL